MLRRYSPIALAIVALLPRPALANPYADLMRVKAAFDAARSWHAVERMSNGHTVTVDYAAPNRWRIRPTPTVTEILIGNDAYMTANGRTVHVPFAVPQIRRIVNQNWFNITPEVRRTLRDRGWRNVGGRRVHEYTFTANGDPVQLYVGSNDLPVRAFVRITQGSVLILYSRYDAPISIAP